jgi:hypothetical protein
VNYNIIIHLYSYFNITFCNYLLNCYTIINIKIKLRFTKALINAGKAGIYKNIHKYYSASYLPMMPLGIQFARVNSNREDNPCTPTEF